MNGVLDKILSEIAEAKACMKELSETINNDYAIGYICALSLAEEVIEHHMNNDKWKWVPTSEAIPLQDGCYIATTAKGAVREDYYYELFGRWAFCRYGNTAGIPKSEPYMPEEEKTWKK